VNTYTEDINKIKKFSLEIRKNILEMALSAGASSAHFGGALSIAEIVSDNTGLITNRKLVRAVLEKEKTKTELEAKLKKIG